MLRRPVRAKRRMGRASEEDWPVAARQRQRVLDAALCAVIQRSLRRFRRIAICFTRRIERAKALLRDSDAPNIEIGIPTGWNSLGHLRRVFRDVTAKARASSARGAGERPSARPGTALLRQRCLRPDLQDRSFGEAAAGAGDRPIPRKRSPQMSEGIDVCRFYVHDQDEALDFYVGKLGFQVHTDAHTGTSLAHGEGIRISPRSSWSVPAQSPLFDAATAHTMREMVAKGAMPPLVLVVDDCRAAYEKLRARASSSYRSRSPASSASTPIPANPSGNA